MITCVRITAKMCARADYAMAHPPHPELLHGSYGAQDKWAHWLGSIGEDGFTVLSRKLQMRFRRRGGESPEDHLLFEKRDPWPVDIKATWGWNSLTLQPRDQWANRGAQGIIIGAFVYDEEDLVCFDGWIYHDEASRQVNPKTGRDFDDAPCVGSHRQDLRSMQTLVAKMDRAEYIRQSDGGWTEVDLCRDCLGLPASAAKYYRRADPAHFCACAFDEAHP